MTREQLTLRPFDLPSIHRFSVGFDNILDELTKAYDQQGNVNYPPYNLIKHDEDHFVIELAVAGFKDGDIDITVEKGVLTIKGEQQQDTDIDDVVDTVEYLHRGIAARNFSRTFTLADYVEVVDAKAENGILRIELERNVPEEQKPKSIKVAFSN